MSQNSANSAMLDTIIQRVIPVIGIIFIVSGIGYLFYTGLWGALDKPARLALGFILSTAFIGGGYGLRSQLKHFADIVISGGILLFYITLIFGSRFASVDDTLIPEVASVFIAILFGVAVSYFAYARESRTILGVNLLGAYLTPFFIGQIDGLNYDLPYNSYLLYFLAINAALFFVAKHVHLRELLLVNMVGLFVSSSFMAGFSADGGGVWTAILYAVIVGFSVYSMMVTSRSFTDKENTYIAVGYLLPLVWVFLNFNIFFFGEFSWGQQLTTYVIMIAVYFGSWYGVRHLEDKEDHYPLYLGGILSIVLAVFSLRENLNEYAGLVVSGTSLIFGVLYLIKPMSSRLYSYVVLSLIGAVVTIVGFLPGYLGSFGPFSAGLSNDFYPYFIILGLLPLMLGYVKKIHAPLPFSLVTAIIGTVISVLILALELIGRFSLPLDFLFFTIPALVVAIALQFMGPNQEGEENKLAILGTILGIAGYISTFFILLDRIYPAPVGIYPFTTKESLVGITSAIVFYLILHKRRKTFMAAGKDLTPLFLLTLLSAVVVLLVVNHELITAFNYIDIDAIDNEVFGLRALTTTFWWIALAAYLIYRGSKVLNFQAEKILGLALLGITILKIVIYDLTQVDTNLKIIILIVTGGIMLLISYYNTRKNS